VRLVADSTVATTEAVGELPQVDAAAAECAPAAIYGPAPACTDDARCVEEHGAEWVCERGVSLVPDGCGGTIEWPTGACKPGPGAAVDAGSSDGGPSSDVVEPDGDDATVPIEGDSDLTPAETGQRPRDSSTGGLPRDLGDPSSMTRPQVDPSNCFAIPRKNPTVELGGLPSRLGPGTLDLDVLRSRFERVRTRASSCYTDALQSKPELAGTVTFAVQVATDGSVTAEVDDNRLRPPGSRVTDCVLRYIRGASFASTPPEGGPIGLHFWLRFSPDS
jgi:hypothetical protein